MKKRIVSALMAFALLFGSTVALPESVVTDSTSITASAEVNTDTSGKCGENVNWSLSGDGVLTISGTGKMYDYSYNTSPFYYRTDIKSVVINSGVTSVGNSAFGNCTNFTSISIPSSLISIGECAFNDCQSLSSVSIPSSVTNIGERAFQSCISLKNIIIPSSIKNIDNYTFNWCTNLESITIPFGVTSIGYYAFGDCTNLSSVIIPNSVTSIGERTFEGCTSLTSITIPNSVTSIGKSAFSDCTSLTSITIPNSVKSIGESAFSDCTSLTSITIPNSVTSISLRLFSGCESLTSVIIPESVTHISRSAFDDTKILNDQTGDLKYIGNWLIKADENIATASVKKGTVGIADEAFYECYNLESVVLPESLIRIGEVAFYYCRNLKSMNIPESVLSIGSGAFIDTKILDDQTGDLKYIGNWLIEANNNIATASIKPGTVGIYDSAFISCESLTRVTIPDSVRIIGNNAFDGCKSLTSITIPNSVTSIGDSAFKYCDGLTSITIPDGVKSIGGDAFYWCTGLTSINIPDSVTSIGGNAFYNCSSLKSVTIPSGVTSISGGMFEECSGLESVTIPDSVTSIGVYAFHVCSKLKTITIPNSVTSIGENAFFSSGLTSVTIPSSVTSIDAYAFYWCTDLTSIDVDSNNDIYSSVDGVLYNKDKTELIKCPEGKPSVTIPNSVTSISSSAFSNCTSLTSVTIPDGVKSIGYSAFSDCENLNSVTIPKSVTSIASNAFGYAWAEKIDGFTIKGFKNSAAEKYATNNGFAFEALAELRITKQPANVTVAKAGDIATFSATATGTGLKYEWYVKDPGGNWTKTGATSNKYSVSITAARNGRQVFCKVIDASGAFVKSNTVTAKYVEKLAITKQPTKVTVAKAGDTASFSVTATGTGLKYEWYIKDIGGSWTKVGSTSNKYSVALKDTRNGRQVFCKVIDSTGTFVKSDIVTATIKGTVVITKQPTNVTVSKAGNTASFTVTALGSNLKYEWYIKDPKGSWTKTGATSKKYSVSITKARNGRQVFCKVIDSSTKNFAKSNTVTAKIK